MIQWTASDDVGVTTIDVAVSADGGTSYTAVAGCTGLAGTAQSCTWADSRARRRRGADPRDRPRRRRAERLGDVDRQLHRDFSGRRR